MVLLELSLIHYFQNLFLSPITKLTPFLTLLASPLPYNLLMLEFPRGSPWCPFYPHPLPLCRLTHAMVPAKTSLQDRDVELPTPYIVCLVIILPSHVLYL